MSKSIGQYAEITSLITGDQFLIQRGGSYRKIQSQNFVGAVPAQIQKVALRIPTADVLTIFATPVELIPTPGANKVIEVVSASVWLDFNSAAYTANVTLNIATVGANVGQFQLTILDAASARHKKMLVNTSVNTEIIANAAVEVKTVGGNPATGDSDIIVFATYYIYDLI